MESVGGSARVGKSVLFWALFGLGTCVLVFAILLTQSPGEDRSFDLIMLSLAALLLVSTFVLGRHEARALVGMRTWPIMGVVLSGELLLCLYAITSILTFRH